MKNNKRTRPSLPNTFSRRVCNGVTLAPSAFDWRQMWSVLTKTIKILKQREKHTSTSYEILRWCRWWCQWKIHVIILMSCCRWLQCWFRCPSWCQGSCLCWCYLLVTMPVFMFVSMSELQTQSWQRKGRKGWGGGGEGGEEGGQLNCADDSTFIFPNKYWTVVRLSASRRICPNVAPRISGSWSRWCSKTCRMTVTDKWRAAPSLVSCQNYQELSNASCLDPAFGSG